MTEISFCAEYSEEPGHCGAPVYLEDEQSLNYVPFDKRVDFSILLGELYVGLDMSGSTGLVSQLSGFLPKGIWKKRSLTPPDAPNGRLYVFLDPPAVRGCGTRYQEERDWPVYFCAANNCLCIGDSKKRPRSQCVQFCEGITAQLDGTRLVSLWVTLGRQNGGLKTKEPSPCLKKEEL